MITELNSPISVTGALNYAYELLKGEPISRLEADLLLAKVLQVSRSFLYAHGDLVIDHETFLKYQDLCQRRYQGEPLAYLIGHKEFWSLELEVNKSTLIPRPETELLVEVMLQELGASDSLSIAELGVGSGAIAIALALERPHWNIIAIDHSAAALKVAKRNRDKYQATNLSLLKSDWYSNLPINKYDAICSNPPYIAQDDPHINELSYEPQIALVSGKNGLEAISKIVDQAGSYLKEGGLLFLEHGYNQALLVRKLLNQAGFTAVKNYLDLNGIERVISAIWSGHGNNIGK